MENIHAGHRDRLRDKALKQGIDTLQDHEVLEIMLSYVIPYKDTNPTSHALLNKFGSIHRVLSMPKEELMTVEGIGEKTAKYIITLGQFAQYYHLFDMKEKKVKLNNPSLAYHYCSKLVSRLEHEEFYVICLNADGTVRCTQKFSSGSSNQTNVDRKAIMSFVLNNTCANVMICHNHPHGSKDPSPNDIDLTKKLFMSFAFSGITLVDHVIVGANSDCYSFAHSDHFIAWNEELTKMFDDEHISSLRSNAMKYDVHM